MGKFDEAKALVAVREAMEQTVAELGIRAVRSLSWFPSSERAELKKAA